MKPVIIIGGGGHAKVVAAALLETKARVLGFCDPDHSRTELLGLPRLGGDEAVMTHAPTDVLLAMGIGSIRPEPLRANVFDRFKALGYQFLTVIHPAATVGPDVELGEGTVVCAGAVIQPGTRTGANCILNTRCSVDHDCQIGPHSHIAPGATLSGGVRTGPNCHIGAGATVIQNVTLGENTLVGAGSVVLRSVQPDTTVFGVPARSIPSRS